MSESYLFPPPLMRQEGPDYEAVFRKMQVLHGGSEEDVKIIKRYLRFFEGTDEYEAYAKHYLPMLSAADAKEFDKADTVVTEITVKEIKEPVTVVAEITVEPSEPVTETVATEVTVKPKRGRPSSK